MSPRGWLVNDCIDTIQGSRTTLSHLLEWFPGLEDCTDGYTPFPQLPSSVRKKAEGGLPDFIIRNASYFPPLALGVPTIALMQDVSADPDFRKSQIAVCRTSDLVVWNSPYTRSMFPELEDVPSKVIPCGIDFDLFKPHPDPEALRLKWGIGERAILYVGWVHEIKGYDRLLGLIGALRGRNFCVVLRDAVLELPRVRGFRSVPHADLVEIMNACVQGVCLSRHETQHMSGIEMGGVGLPLVTTNVGAFWNRPPGPWGRTVDASGAAAALSEPVQDYQDVRNYWLDSEFSLESCRASWKAAVDKVLR